MYTLKAKVSEKLSRLFLDSPSSSSSPTSTRHYPPAWSDALGGKSLSSYFSYINPSNVFSGSKSTKQHHDLEPLQSTPVRYSSINNNFSEEQLDNFAECHSVCRTKETLITHQEDKECSLVGEKKDKLNNEGDNDDQGSGQSTSDSEVFEEAMEQHGPQKFLPNLTDDSVFISGDLYEFFLSCLPNIVKGCKWVLLYSTLKDGISLRTLIRKSNDLSCPCLLIVGDKQGAVFGGLLECPLKPTAKRKYQGTNQTFVFTTIYGEPRLFRPTGANRYYYLCLNDTLALGGGGHFALCLDGDLLNGTSGPCETFGNVCLAHDPEFELKNVELWGFIHASQYLPRKEEHCTRFSAFSFLLFFYS